jgi:hypothetical protein
MKTLLLSLLAGCLALSLEAQTSLTNYSALGELLLVKLDSAPFPHLQRAEGHKYGAEFFPADKHYQDNTVGIFVPKGFQRAGAVDFVVHFHGWRNHVEKALNHYELIEQFVESGRNAILVVPQGPYDAADSFDGKLEDENGFKRFMQEVMGTLRGHKVIGEEPIGSIVLSGHSGGYQVISSILAQGGLTEQVREVWLFDALYGRTEKFAKWFEQSPKGRLINIYTAHGGTRAETEKWMEDLKQKSARFLTKKEAELGAEELRKNRLIFIFTELEHDEVPMKHRAFAEYLRTSSLAAISRAEGIK